MRFEKITYLLESLYDIVTFNQEDQLRLERLEGLAKVVLTEWMTNNNLVPAAWNIFYELRESGRLTHKSKSKIDHYAFASSVVRLLISLYGPRLSRFSADTLKPYDRKEVKKLMKVVDRNSVEGVAAVLAFIEEESELILDKKVVLQLVSEVILAKNAPWLLTNSRDSQNSIDMVA
jgi:hypothetical protein